jgi:hypothetical protein
MAKTKENEIMEDAVIIVSPEQETQALIEAETNKMIASAITDLKKSTVTDEAIAHLKAEYGALSIADISDLQGYNAVKDGATKVKKLRTAVEAKRKELTEPALKFQRDVKAEADRIAAELKPIEEELNKKKKDYEDAVEAAKRAEYQRRVSLMYESGYQLINGFFVCGIIQVHSDELGKIAQPQLEVYVKHGQDELERAKAEKLRKEQEEERQRQEKEAERQRQLAEDERIRKEREALEKEKADFAAWKAQQQAELTAQTVAIETTYETVVQPVHASPSIEFGAPIHDAPPIQNMQAVAHAYVAPEQPQPVHTPQPQPQQTNQYVPADEFERGFNAFRVALTDLVNNTAIPLSRNSLRDWAWSTPFPKH